MKIKLLCLALCRLFNQSQIHFLLTHTVSYVPVRPRKIDLDAKTKKGYIEMKNSTKSSDVKKVYDTPIN